jgi:hypothetical protein
MNNEIVAAAILIIGLFFGFVLGAFIAVGSADTEIQ